MEVPAGNGTGHLTSDFNKVKPNGRYGPRSGAPSSVSVQRQGSNAFQATATDGTTRFAPSAGPAVLKVAEKGRRGPGVRRRTH
ncbi:hypothetical protein ABZ470_20530 [Streptosporangium sp. NPDC020072]|uniref:hypothetical protein n=1 Tax=Streptosporangium sp. NPDC020072 TaxID=3154788 RepID=UPI00344AED8B